MSRDVHFFNIDKVHRTIFGMDQTDFRPFGTPDSIAEKILSVFPDANIADPTWIVIEGEGYSLQVSTGIDEPIWVITSHGHGWNQDAALAKLAQGTGWRVVDPNIGDIESTAVAFGMDPAEA